LRHRALVVALLLLSACKSAEQKLLDANREKITAALGQLKALAPIVEKQPPLEEARWPVAGAKVGENTGVVWANVLTGTCNDMRTTYAADNSGSDYIHLDVDRSEYWFEKPTCGLEGNENLIMGLSEKDVETLIGMKYALVLRATVKEQAQLDPAEVAASLEAYQKTGKGTDIEHFIPGRLAGDALLYELATGKLVGNFPFDARSSDKVKASSTYQELVYDLNAQLDRQLRAKL
jgi:hypothetical protein